MSHPSQRLTVTSPATGRPRTHCQIHGSWMAGSQFSQEVGRLLHSRLRIVSLLALVPLVVRLAVTLLDPDLQEWTRPVTLGLHACVIAVLATGAAFVWFRPEICPKTLRKLEVGFLLLLAGFFGWMQVNLLNNPALQQLHELDLDCGLGVVRVWVEGSASRWFFLIVIYGVFIPNTWKRCAMLTGVTALLPVSLTGLGAWWYGRFCPEVGDGMVTLAISAGTAWAVAVFGAHRLQTLQQEAFQARQLGQYRLGNKIGAGGMGEVYQAEHVLLRRRCALKLIRAEQMYEPATLGRFEREVRAMATLTHWNTVEVYDYGHAEDGTFYYVMEYLDGLNLEALVSRHGPVSPARAIHLLRQVCGALREAHGVGLLHRDIKPSNIIACRRGGVDDVAKLLDFGLVQQTHADPEAEKLTIQGAAIGSPPYMAPEQAQGRTDLGVGVDIYGLGGVAYFLLTGRPPFVRETAMEMMMAHAYEPVVAPGDVRPGLPADLQAVILRCLEKKPQARFASAEELEKALAGCGDAAGWTDDDAARWWTGKAAPGETREAEAATLA